MKSRICLPENIQQSSYLYLQGHGVFDQDRPQLTIELKEDLSFTSLVQIPQCQSFNMESLASLQLHLNEILKRLNISMYGNTCAILRGKYETEQHLKLLCDLWPIQEEAGVEAVDRSEGVGELLELLEHFGVHGC